MSEELTPSQRALIARNRERAEQLRLSQIVANDQNVYASVRVAKRHRPSATDGGFIPEDEVSEDQTLSQQFEKDEELTDDEFESGCQRRTKRHRRIRGLPLSSTEHGPPDVDHPLPLPSDEDKPLCDQCNRTFDDSFLRKHFDVDVCDRCRDPKGLHTMITKSTAKDRYLVNDVDLDVREPKLRFILKRNPHNSIWGDMRLYLEAQVAQRSLEIWGSEDKLEAERERRARRVEASKLKHYNKRIKDLKVQTRSSLFTKTTATHEHSFGPETYDREKDVYVKRCTECNYTNVFEKL